MANNIFNRTELLLGKDAMSKLASAKVIVFGVGGVGGYVCEMLTRSGVGHLTIVDFDKVDVTNINRQIIATTSTIGCSKVQAMATRLLDINPDIQVTIMQTKYSADNYEQFCLQDYDYVVDAIDIVTDKIHLIVQCHKLGVRCISAMGAGNRKYIPHFEVADVYSTHDDGLAKIIRKKLRENNIEHHLVVFSADKRENVSSDTIASIAYYPAMCGCVLSAQVINDLIE